MYVNLYPTKQLKRTKRSLLWSGLFLLCGGLVALLSEFGDGLRWGWALAALLICLTGFIWVAVGVGRIHLKDMYFSMTPERISYRLSLYGPERVIFWNSIDSIQTSEHTVVFDLQNGEQVVMRLGNIQCSRTANHVSVSIQLAAIEQNVEVNKVPVQSQKVA